MTKDQMFLKIAELIATQAECPRRSVGCVLVDGRDRIVGTGYNARAAGHAACDADYPCDGHWLPRGKGLSKCEAIHSEERALLHRTGDVVTAYVTVSPCVPCTRKLLEVGCLRVVFGERCTSDDGAREAFFRERRRGAEWMLIKPDGSFEVDTDFSVERRTATEIGV
jgi:dCMP deaminase